MCIVCVKIDWRKLLTMNSAPNAPPAYEDVATLRHENFYYSPTPPYALPEFIQGMQWFFKVKPKSCCNKHLIFKTPAPPQNIIIVNSPAPQSRDPTRMRCPNCLDEIETRIESRATTQTHVIALLLCLFVLVECFINLLKYGLSEIIWTWTNYNFSGAGLAHRLFIVVTTAWRLNITVRNAIPWLDGSTVNPYLFFI